VLRNKPYAGGFITEHYGEPNVERHALQIEINRGLYMNEATLAITPGFSELVWHLRSVVTAVAAEVQGLSPARMAAE
jgi:N-formylglutamate amidohydrolase